MLFYGPGNGAWLSMNNQRNGDLAKRSGVSAEVIQEAQLKAVGRVLNWRGLTVALQEREVKKAVRRTAAGAVAVSLPWVARGILYSLPSVARGTTRVGIGYRIGRFAMRGAPRALTRAVPILGWALLAWDVYTVTTRGELWGVQIWSQEG